MQPTFSPSRQMLSVFLLIDGESTISPEPQLQNLISTTVQKSSPSNQTLPLLQSKAVSSYSVNTEDANNSHCNNESNIRRQLRPFLVISHRNGQPPLPSASKARFFHQENCRMIMLKRVLGCVVLPTWQIRRAGHRDGESRRKLCDRDDLGLPMPGALCSPPH